MLFEHRDLRPHKLALNKAINSGNNQDIEDALQNHLNIIIQKLRSHINTEDEILYTLALDLFTEKELAEMAQAAELPLDNF
jgi:hemerythrin-like domain-containing protein